MAIAKRAMERRLATTLGATSRTRRIADGSNPTAPRFARPLGAEGKMALDGQESVAQTSVG